ncbi:MAG: squalene--hopene cyclase [Dehalococcoidia bacterium]|nr:squalene--hopene cyclase [Dehalococcoidia bacterium]
MSSLADDRTTAAETVAAADALLREARLPAGDLDEALRRGAAHLLSMQAAEGYWWAELESNVTMAAEHLLLERFLGISHAERQQKICRYILDKQGADGGWPVYYGGPGDISVTVEAYFALKVGGVDPQSPAITRARDFVRAHGGARRARIFTKIWLALFGQFDWEALPAMPPEAILLPERSPVNIYEFASWARATMVAILVIWSKKPVASVPAGAAIDELYLREEDRRELDLRRERNPFSWRNVFLATDRLLKLAERSPWKPLRKRALRTCEAWIVDHQEEDGSWGGIQPPWVYSLIALKCLGYANDHPVMRKGVDGLLTEFALETEETFTVQPCLSPIWDTALAVTGLREAGVPADEPSLVRAGQWLLDKEIRARGDWCVKVKDTPPGGWAFEFFNDKYPDTDDTAEVLIALRLLNLSGRGGGAEQRARRWLLAMQSRNGGWAAFDVDNTKRLVTRIAFCDFGATLDPPSEDVTAHVLEWLMLGGAGSGDPAVRRALRYLWRTQERDGSWFGRWGVNYVYGLGAVLPALAAAGIRPSHRRMRRAVQWLERHQNADGGWGESCASYDDPSLRGQGPSTASQTAWALLALLAANRADSRAVARGVAYLVSTQQADGHWEEPEFTGTGFPRDFMLNYHLYRDYWPLWALGRYRRLRLGQTIHRPGDDPWS